LIYEILGFAQSWRLLWRMMVEGDARAFGDGEYDEVLLPFFALVTL